MIDFLDRKFQIFPLVFLYLLLLSAFYFSAIFYQDHQDEIFVENAAEEVQSIVEERLLTAETLIEGLSQYLVLDNANVEHKFTSIFIQKVANQYPFVEAIGVLNQPDHLKNLLSSEKSCSFLISANNSICPNKQEWNRLLKAEALVTTLQQAIRSGDIEVSPPLEIKNGPKLIVYAKAIYKNHVSPTEISQRTANLQELVLVFINLEHLLFLGAPVNQSLNVQLQWINSDKYQKFTNAAYANHYENIIDINCDYFPYDLVITTKKPFSWLNYKTLLVMASLSLLVWGGIVLILYLIRKNRQNAIIIQSIDSNIEKNQQIILSNISDAVIQLDENLNIKQINHAAEKLLDLVRSEVVGHDSQTIFDIVRTKSSQNLKQMINLLLQSQNAIFCVSDSQIQLKNTQKTFAINGWLIPIMGLNNIVTGFCLLLQPARAKEDWPLSSESIFKVHSDEFVRVFRVHTIEQMASGIAHEINQPLSAVLSYNEGCLDLLDEMPIDVDNVRHGLVCAIEQAKRAGHIMTALRNTLGKNRPMDRGPVNINQSVENALALLSHDIKKYTIKIDKQLSKDLPIVLADTIQLEQVIMNLIRNAIEACRENKPWGNILISSMQVNGMIQVCVKDDGYGISEDKLNCIFNPFFSTKSDGMGLGLTISQSIIESFGGTIHAANRQDGRGVEFYFDLPIP